MDLSIRAATETDTPSILRLLRSLAAYKGTVNPIDEDAIKSILVYKQAEIAIGYVGEEDVCFALYSYKFSVLAGKSDLCLEDFYVLPEWRSNGFGRKMFAYLSRVAVERGCRRLEWGCLDSHKKTIEFYTKVGASPLSEWTLYCLDGKALEDLGQQGV